MRHTYYDMKGNEHTIEIPDEYIESKRQQAILKASAANLYLLEHGIEYDAQHTGLIQTRRRRKCLKSN